MSDIVEWLRGANEILPRWRRLIEAADEIERLRDEIEQLKMRMAEAEWEAGWMVNHIEPPPDNVKIDRDPDTWWPDDKTDARRNGDLPDLIERMGDG